MMVTKEEGGAEEGVVDRIGRIVAGEGVETPVRKEILIIHIIIRMDRVQEVTMWVRMMTIPIYRQTIPISSRA